MEAIRQSLIEKQLSQFPSQEHFGSRSTWAPKPITEEHNVRHTAQVEVERPVAVSEGIAKAPIISSRNWDIQKLLKRGKHFEEVPRISALMPPEALLRAINEYEASDKPLIIEGWHEHPAWPKDLFNVDRLVEQCGDQTWSVRNVRDYSDRTITLAEFIAWSRRSANDKSRNGDELLYGKDAPCPPEWRDWVEGGKVIPSVLCPKGPGDLFQNLQQSEDVESLMCYFGIGDTFTPCHKDLCASSGHNIMCYAENGGSSFWFMTASSDAPAVGAHFQKIFGQELDWEAHTATVSQFAEAPFTVYVAEQRVGDLVLVPPRSCHQVVNHGGLTVKTSWSRMTVQGLSTALYHELPIYRRVCRPEQYRVKQILYCSLKKYGALLMQHFKDSSTRAVTPDDSHLKVASDLAALVDLFDFVLEEEYTSRSESLVTVATPERPRNADEVAYTRRYTRGRKQTQRRVHPPSEESTSPGISTQSSCNFACDFCGADIFQSFFECRNSCQPSEMCSGPPADGKKPGDGLLICPSCYVDGRTCACGEMRPLQCRPFGNLLTERNMAAFQLEKVSHEPSRRHQISPKELFMNARNLRVFEAGCTLSRLREEEEKMLKCRCGYTGAARSEVFHCRECHGSKCIKHLLDDGVHSAEAILKYHQDRAWHDFHKQSRVDFKNNVGAFDEAERKGDVTSYKDRLVLVARRYKSCQSLNPRDTRLGWYDQPSMEAIEPSKGVKERTKKPNTHSTKDFHPPTVHGTRTASCPSGIFTTAAVQDRCRESKLRPMPPPPLVQHSDSPLSSLASTPTPTLAPSRHTVDEPTTENKRRRRMQVEVMITTRPPKRKEPPSGSMANRAPRQAPRPEALFDDKDDEQDDYTSGLVSAITNASNRSAESPPPEDVRVQGRRIVSASQSPTTPSAPLPPQDGSPVPTSRKRKASDNRPAPAARSVRRRTTSSASSSDTLADRSPNESMRQARSGLKNARFGVPTAKKGSANLKGVARAPTAKAAGKKPATPQEPTTTQDDKPSSPSQARKLPNFTKSTGPRGPLESGQIQPGTRLQEEPQEDKVEVVPAAPSSILPASMQATTSVSGAVQEQHVQASAPATSTALDVIPATINPTPIAQPILDSFSTSSAVQMSRDAIIEFVDGLHRTFLRDVRMRFSAFEQVQAIQERLVNDLTKQIDELRGVKEENALLKAELQDLKASNAKLEATLNEKMEKMVQEHISRAFASAASVRHVPSPALPVMPPFIPQGTPQNMFPFLNATNPNPGSTSNTFTASSNTPPSSSNAYNHPHNGAQIGFPPQVHGFSHNHHPNPHYNTHRGSARGRGNFHNRQPYNNRPWQYDNRPYNRYQNNRQQHDYDGAYHHRSRPGASRDHSDRQPDRRFEPHRPPDDIDRHVQEVERRQDERDREWRSRSAEGSYRDYDDRDERYDRGRGRESTQDSYESRARTPRTRSRTRSPLSPRPPRTPSHKSRERTPSPAVSLGPGTEVAPSRGRTP